MPSDQKSEEKYGSIEFVYSKTAKSAHFVYNYFQLNKVCIFAVVLEHMNFGNLFSNLN